MERQPHMRLVEMRGRGRCDLCGGPIERGEVAVVFSISEGTSYQVRRSYHRGCVRELAGE